MLGGSENADDLRDIMETAVSGRVHDVHPPVMVDESVTPHKCAENAHGSQDLLLTGESGTMQYYR